jgi:F420-dependent methylenetetrahydromethanopterin dehydrogenase
MHISDKLRNKLDGKSLKYILMGYDEHLKANRLYQMPFKIAKISRDVMINE